MGRKAGRLRRGRLRTEREEGAFNPLDGMANLADLMLVFACGLMLSLIIHWNVDVGRMEKLLGLNVDTKLTEVNDTEKKTVEDLKNGQGLEELGTVYRDPATGKLYVVSMEEE
jgi:hypothetical protein